MCNGDAATVILPVRRLRKRGAALVECALVMPFVLLLVIGVVEAGRMTRSQFALAQSAREGAQAAARGLSTQRIQTRILNTAESGGLLRNNVSVTEMLTSSNGTSWRVLGNKSTGLENDAHRQDFVRVTVQYRHSYLCRLVFSGGTRTLRSSVVARRN